MTNALKNNRLDLGLQAHAPLAARMRPQSLANYQGQAHLLAKSHPLGAALHQKKPLHSLILWGEAGVGKTSLAYLLAKETGMRWAELSAVDSGIKEIRQVVAQAAAGASVVFVDEIHRFNKTQQDALLPHVESGAVVLIGATTENPTFALTAALRSRTAVYRLEPLTAAEILPCLQRALKDATLGLGAQQFQVEAKVLEHLSSAVGGDLRQAYNVLERMALSLETKATFTMTLLEATLKAVLGSGIKQADTYYALLSAFHKAIRGSDPDAALYWLARAFAAGMAPLDLGRRLLAIASEDVGNADPQAMTVALNAWQCFERVGAAEGERALAQAAVYLACAPKSNALYLAFKAAKACAQDTHALPVPAHLCPGSDAYRYAHNEPNQFAAGQSYLPEVMHANPPQFYQPLNVGFEQRIATKMTKLKQLNQMQKEGT